MMFPTTTCGSDVTKRVREDRVSYGPLFLLRANTVARVLITSDLSLERLSQVPKIVSTTTSI
jgi:hypothetical protein